jgi:adenine-specific DNA methylase
VNRHASHQPCDAEPASTDSPGAAEQVFRPFQYLGSKLRSLDAIAEAATDIAGPNATVLDPFCGSTVVCQRLADAGMTVRASDALGFCAVAARATLGVARNSREESQALDVLEVPTPMRGLEAWVERERQALEDRDGNALLDLGRTVPQVWRRGNGPKDRSAIVSSHYAGTYFGVWQSLRLDALRQAIEPLDGWDRSVALTALFTSMSACAYTAGKHFAQPHKTSRKKDLTFHQRRALADRGTNVDDVYRDAVAALMRRPTMEGDGHDARQAKLSELRADSSIDLIYADPPYTAQQYSRFYHVPEVVLQYEVPKLQVHRGAVTSGLYPEGRFKSDFCSKRRVGDAFRRLAGLAAASNAALLVSYSGSRPGTGNDRMISLDDLTSLLKEYGPVTVYGLDHNYRQFNRTENAVGPDSDPECLILCRVPSC